MKNSFGNYTPFRTLLLVLFLVLVSTLVISVLAVVVAIPFIGISGLMKIVQEGVSTEEGHIGFLKYLQIVQSIGVFILPSFMVAFLVSNNSSQYLHISKRPSGYGLGISILILLVSLPLMNILGEWNGSMSLPQWMQGVEQWMRAKEDQAEVITKLFLDSKTTTDLLVNVLMIGIIPGVGEELLFRGVIQKILKNGTHNDHWAVWITAILFSAIHLQFYGFIPRVLLGATFGYLFVISRNLWLPIIAHFLNNTIAVVAYHFFNIGELSVNPDDVGIGRGSWLWAIICILVLAVLFYKLKLYYDSEKTTLSVMSSPTSSEVI